MAGLRPGREPASTAGRAQPPGGASPAELLHETKRSRITRLVLPDATVIRKEPLGPDAPGRLRHEVQILTRLSGLSGIAQLAEKPQPATPTAGDAIFLTDVGGAPLCERPVPMDYHELLGLAESLARAVAAMHHRGVIHCDLNPTNVIVSADLSALCLIDFALAVVSDPVALDAPPVYADRPEIIGTVPYLAPELAGRTGRPVDVRADLYALGTTLYELATGAAPFGAGDPVRIIHDHLARVPNPPVRANPAVSSEFSDILMHLLEKEPDDRYQTADGLVYDLTRLRRDGRLTRPGEHDLPARPLTPSRLVGRDREIDELRAAFLGMLAGRCGGVLLSGPAGTGKTSLAAQLRPVVAAHGGWFVAGKFDQYRRDQDYDGVLQALRALGRQLLAQPEVPLARIRDRLLQRLGPAAGLAAALVPELAVLLRVPPDPGDPFTAQARAQHNAVEILRAVVSPDRPLVFFVDDLQWAGRTPLGLVDEIFCRAEPVEGLLLVGAYRDDAVDATHPLAPLLASWAAQPDGPPRLRLGGLATAGQADLLADLLSLRPQATADLSRVVMVATRGNPYDTIELVNALRHDGLLTWDDGAWRWDLAVLRRRLGPLDVTALLVERAATLPRATQNLLSAMACLAGQLELDLLATAVGRTPGETRRRLAPAIADGLVVAVGGDQENVRFCHDRVHEAVFAGLAAPARRDVKLALARRLAKRPEFATVAAEQYLDVLDALDSIPERRRVGQLLRRAAAEARVLGAHLLVERFLTAALTLVDPADVAALIELHTERHGALYRLGWLDEADGEFQTIDQLSAYPADRTAAVAVQIMSLTNRSRGDEALGLGLDHLRRLGVTVPDRAELDGEIDRGMTQLYAWINDISGPGDVRQAARPSRKRRAMVRIIQRLMPAAFFYDQRMMDWMAVTALRMWMRDGPDPDLVGSAAHIAFTLIIRRGDYATAHRVMRRILAPPRASAGDAERWEAELAEARLLYTISTGHWFDALEDNAAEARQVTAALSGNGDMQNACWTQYVLLCNLLDCSPSLDAIVAEVDKSLAFATRTGNRHSEEVFRSFRHLAHALLGDATQSETNEATELSLLADNPPALAHLHVTRAIAAAIFDQPADLARHTAAVLPFSPTIGASYTMAITRVLRALALAAQARVTATNARDAMLAELADLVAWLSTRADDAPANFRHLLRLVEAERAWAVGDFQQAAYAFDLARQECHVRTRPWHRAVILERTARFYLAHGMNEAGRSLLVDARREYSRWGATAKVLQLDWANPTLCVEPASTALVQRQGDDTDGVPRRATLAAGTIDLLGVVAASQALSSETSLAGLRARVVGILSEMTGATGVRLLLRDDGGGWSVHDEAGSGAALDATAARGQVPFSVVWYAERTQEPIVVADVTRDDRFHDDPCFAGLDRCSLSAVPILIRNELRAMLLLENRMIRGAFSTERLDGVMLIARQLAVSLDNALVYASLEAKVADRTRQLAAANARLAAANTRLSQLSVTDPLTGLANRRRLEDVLGSEWDRSRQQHVPLALAMVDIDHFKSYNDHYGHAAGDRCLQRVAGCLATNVGDTELAARYGGEEFAIVMPDADQITAGERARCLCAAVARIAEPHAPARQRIVTVSVGVASVVPDRESHAIRLVELADSALYQAKRAGRGRVCTASA
ncbi:diguanylate cyclase domain-containing protein [Parafrankia sp. EUN1f]|uniref:diguanylate cyclase domain-containing protein n=1 Tax=Parafrankia sp. EUN1f TaxID=102897 RepID=UPI0001C43DE7|nr:diguanylate cyclase [Parafrankia sp. EUN1f]EFC85749.1 serine/threonine protein kinase [Parafrankia sp. EUN1f]